MASRTPEGKHTKRYIVLKKNGTDTKFVRSYSIPGFFATRDEALAVVAERQKFYPNVQYRVRQK
jgi:hypothetical protein